MKVIELVGDEESRIGMEKYMRNQFPFVGVPKPIRAAQSKEYVKYSKELATSDLLKLVDELFEKKGREYKYVAIDLIQVNYQRLTIEEVESIIHYFQVESWWETVDTLRVPMGKYILLHPEYEQRLFDHFFKNDDFWMRRVAITLQLQFKDKTNLELLAKAIEADIDTDEFFIQKAIGWALRDYSKTNPEWVREFIKKHELSKLAVREGSKYI